MREGHHCSCIRPMRTPGTQETARQPTPAAKPNHPAGGLHAPPRYNFGFTGMPLYRVS